MLEHLFLFPLPLSHAKRTGTVGVAQPTAWVGGLKETD